MTAGRPRQHVARTGLSEEPHGPAPAPRHAALGLISSLATCLAEEDLGRPGRGDEEDEGREELLDVVFIQLTVHSTDAHVLHHLNTTESCNTSA